MNSKERRDEILRILIARRRETASRLAAGLSVSERTIRRDVLYLTADHPLETQQGNGGCVKVADWYHPHRNILSEEQQQALMRKIASSDENDARILRELITEYGSANYRILLESEAG